MPRDVITSYVLVTWNKVCCSHVSWICRQLLAEVVARNMENMRLWVQFGKIKYAQCFSQTGNCWAEWTCIKDTWTQATPTSHKRSQQTKVKHVGMERESRHQFLSETRKCTNLHPLMEGITNCKRLSMTDCPSPKYNISTTKLHVIDWCDNVHFWCD